MLDWLAELFQPIIAAIMSLLVWLGIVSPHKNAAVSESEHVLPESGQYEAAHVEKPAEEVPVPSNE
jgi:uncharacterized membrane protein